jgi:mono/diheme cytochrome c family protein
MKKIKKILKWTSVLILITIAGIAGVAGARQDLTFTAPYPEITSSKDSSVIARGRHLVNDIAHCNDCHSQVNADSLIRLGQDVPLSGSVAFRLPVGVIYSANITSDSLTGIGRFSDREIARVLRYGVHPNGAPVYNFMPFQNLTDSDLTAIISYLRVQPAIRQPKKENELNLVGNMVKAFMVKPVGPSAPILSYIKPDSTVEYGQYLVQSVGNCSGCHTKHNLSGEVDGAIMAGGNPMPNGLVPPNLTPDSTGRIFGWSQDMFIQRFRMGKIIPESEMPWNSFKRMEDLELKAIYNYLHAIPAVKSSKP